jgi:hypothetical protein
MLYDGCSSKVLCMQELKRNPTKVKYLNKKMLKTSERQLVFCTRLQSSFSRIRSIKGTWIVKRATPFCCRCNYFHSANSSLLFPGAIQTTETKKVAILTDSYQVFGSVSGSALFWVAGFGSRKEKMTHEKRKKVKKLHVMSIEWSLLGAEGFSCSLGVLYRDK